MAKRKTPELSPEAVAANIAGEANREKEKRARTKNNEKQKRYRDGMKAAGYKQVLLWAYPCPADVRKKMEADGYRQVPAWEKAGRKWDRNILGLAKMAVEIRTETIDAAARLPEVQEAINRAAAAFLACVGDSPEGKAAYSDFIKLVSPLGDPWGGLA